jgi:hypothetical protein
MKSEPNLLILWIPTAVALAFVLTLMAGGLYVQQGLYRQAAALALPAGPTAAAALVTIARALDFAIVKDGAVFLGFGVVLLGALYLLRAVQATYSLNATTGTSGALSLQTTSPGLVMITLGVVTVLFALSRTSVIELDSTGLAHLPAGNVPQAKGESGAPRDAVDKNATQGHDFKLADFEKGASALNTAQRAQLDGILQSTPASSIAQLEITAADEDAGEPEYQLALRERRESAIRDYVQSRLVVRGRSQGEERAGRRKGGPSETTIHVPAVGVPRK